MMSTPWERSALLTPMARARRAVTTRKGRTGRLNRRGEERGHARHHRRLGPLPPCKAHRARQGRHLPAKRARVTHVGVSSGDG